MTPEQYCGIHKSLQGGLIEWTNHWQNLANYALPRKAFITESFMSPTTEQSDRLYDNTLQYAVHVNANGRMTLTTPRHEPWFILRPPRRLRNNDRVEKWYSEVTEIIREELEWSNYYEIIHEFMIDGSAFGTAALHIEEGRESLFNFTALEIGSYAIAVNSRDLCDTFDREVKYTIAQAVDEFGEENLSPKTRERWNTRIAAPQAMEEKIEFVNLVLPRHKRDTSKIDSGNLPWADCWLEKEQKHIVREQGYHEMPYLVSRYLRTDKRQGPYGYSPSWMALPDARQLNELERYADYMAELKAFPRMLVPGKLKGKLDHRAGMPTYYDPAGSGTQKPEVWGDGGSTEHVLERAQRKREDIRSAFNVDYFEMFANLEKQMTAHEIVAREREKLVQFSPMQSRLTSEVFNPLMRRLFGIGLRASAFPEAPQEVVDVYGGFAEVADPDVEYTNKIALAAGLQQQTGFLQMLESWAPILEIQPEVLMNADFNRQFRDTWRAFGLDPDNLRDEDEVAQMAAEMQQQREQERQMMMAGEAAKAAGNVVEKMPAGAALEAVA